MFTNKWLLALLVGLLFGGSSPAAEKLKVLIVDGQNNHNWQATTPAVAKILVDSGRFTVDVATSPPKGQDLSGFRPAFSQYDAVVSNYNGQLWSDDAQRDLVEYVRGGGGLVVFHAANNTFSSWKEYNEMIGLGGWGGRSEKSGPYLRLREGTWVKDLSPGRGGREHGTAPFVVETFAPQHPVMAGLPAKWLHAPDQLVFDLRGPAEHVTVLATSFSPKEKGGIGEAVPMIFTIDYGRGRVFHTPMGHDVRSVTCAGFATILQRGAEWAATGKVTLPVPTQFPTEDEVQMWSPPTN